MAKKPDWSKLPKKLAYLAVPAMKYGHYQFEDRIFGFLDEMSRADKEELRTLLEQMIKDESAIDAWLDAFPITKHVEARLVYFLEHLLALGNDAGYFG